MSAERRNAAYGSWGRSSALIFRSIFKIFRSFTLAVLFMEVDENGHNPAWPAVEYPGPDPSLSTPSLKESETGPEESEGKRCPRIRPLDDAVVDLRGVPAASVGKTLAQAGCQLLPEMEACKGLLPERQGGKSKPPVVAVVNCDAVVVGSGSGGGTVAARLAEAGMEVLVLEKGTYYAREDFSLLEGPSSAALYDKGGMAASDDGAIAVLAGSTLGGGSTINWAASFRTPPHVCREWADEYGLKRYESEEYQKAMDAVCERLGVHDDETVHGFMNAALWKGSEKLGYPLRVIPRNAPGAHSCNWCHMGCRSGAKQSTTETWLLDAAKAGARILTGCTVERVLHAPKKSGQMARENGGVRRGRRACGVLVGLNGGAEHLVVEAKTVVVACGSLRTPALLLQSGLRNPAIGRTLRLHPVGAVWGLIPEGPDLPGRSFEGAIMTACSTVAANWESSGYGALLQTPFAHPGLSSIAMPWQGGKKFKELFLRYPRVVIIIAITRDTGYGQVYVNKEGEPDVRYTLNKTDEKHMMNGLEHALRILHAAGATTLGTTNPSMEFFHEGPLPNNSASLPSQTMGNDSTLEAYIQGYHSRGLVKNGDAVFSAHQTGSCRMGTSARPSKSPSGSSQAVGSVVDSEGECWEVEGLFLGDGSVLPTPCGVNPMITIQSMAFCIGEGIAKRFKEGALS
eukprot:TRINITY_DN36011_c0_g1_i1.p1 TRINITY_DN36011_c0_g1~~TRINITY_DN36011_c0_g1_i1.p1  ORF type:complete len:699 (+),score=90.63 TRINITY_DN36011_c0_g1_i1:46-2097(+)